MFRPVKAPDLGIMTKADGNVGGEGGATVGDPVVLGADLATNWERAAKQVEVNESLEDANKVNPNPVVDKDAVNVEEKGMHVGHSFDVPAKKRNIGKGVENQGKVSSGIPMSSSYKESVMRVDTVTATDELNCILNDEVIAEKLQLEEIKQFESGKQNVSVLDDSLMGDGKLHDDMNREENNSLDGLVDNTENISGEEGGRIHITDSEEYIDSQESVDFAARVGLVLPDKDQEEEELRRCDRLKAKEDKTVLQLATSRKEAQNAFVDKGFGSFFGL
ncbi:hypothetical protein GUJ93_ZPchr0002g26506 [Zizania palustris]|uniref:Uncharacterized protein n=1 Tax=Zizania palustris TaxID=103762 RepID=A0A8J5RQR6_ZIZPA|nr:hypothetical protein GUJ93_ZPchr0002g26506 [Zizania palustris]